MLQKQGEIGENCNLQWRKYLPRICADDRGLFRTEGLLAFRFGRLSYAQKQLFPLVAAAGGGGAVAGERLFQDLQLRHAVYINQPPCRKRAAVAAAAGLVGEQ